MGVKARSTHGEMRVLLNRGVWHSVPRQVLLSARNDWCLPTHTAAKVMADVIYPPIHPSVHLFFYTSYRVQCFGGGWSLSQLLLLREAVYTLDMAI